MQNLLQLTPSACVVQTILSGSASIPIAKKTDLHIFFFLALLTTSLALDEEQAVPLYPPEEALQLSHRPQAYMADRIPCEELVV